MQRYRLSIEDLILEAAGVVLIVNTCRWPKRRRLATKILLEFFRRFDILAEAASDGLELSYEAASRGAANDLHFAAVCYLATVYAAETAAHWMRHAAHRKRERRMPTPAESERDLSAPTSSLAQTRAPACQTSVRRRSAPTPAKPIRLECGGK